MAANRRYVLNLFLSADEYMRFYQGAARNVVATATSGQRVQFPANLLRPFVTRDGVSGLFVLEVDENNKVAGFHKAG